jgi:glycerol-3-phosphate dehydrogenase (NAD(P)+)
MNEVPRGVKAVTVVIDMANRPRINMPIAAEVDGLVNKGCTAEGEDR